MLARLDWAKSEKTKDEEMLPHGCQVAVIAEKMGRAAAVAGTQPWFGYGYLGQGQQVHCQPAFRAGLAHPNFPDGKGISGQKIINMPAPLFFYPQMPPEPGGKMAPRRADIEIAAGFKVNLS
jgi:hypothetical protein